MESSDLIDVHVWFLMTCVFVNALQKFYKRSATLKTDSFLRLFSMNKIKNIKMKSNKMYCIKVALGLSIMVLGFSCSKHSPKYHETSETVALDETGEMPDLNSYQIEEESSAVAPKKNTHNDVKIIKNATSRIKVKNVDEATRLAKQITKKYEGYISDERFTNTNYTKENRFTIKIPQQYFDEVLDQVCAVAEFVDHKNISTVDVTEEYVDLTSRLKTKLEVKKRYETILRTNAKTVKDILATEEKLKELQEEIEAAQGRLQYISARVTFSSIQVDMYETVVPKEEPKQYIPGFWDKAKSGLEFGWTAIQQLTLILFYIWPLLLAGVFIFIYFKWVRK